MSPPYSITHFFDFRNPLDVDLLLTLKSLSVPGIGFAFVASVDHLGIPAGLTSVRYQGAQVEAPVVLIG